MGHAAGHEKAKSADGQDSNQESALRAESRLVSSPYEHQATDSPQEQEAYGREVGLEQVSLVLWIGGLGKQLDVPQVGHAPKQEGFVILLAQKLAGADIASLKEDR